MIEALISSKTRVKLLLKFFLNSNSTSYLRGLESEFQESSNAIRVELNRFEEVGMLKSNFQGNKKFFRANTEHPLYSEINSIVLKYIGFDKIIEHVIHRLGDVEKVYVVGDFAKGKNAKIIDLLFVGNIEKEYLLKLVEKAEMHISRKIRYIIYSPDEFIADNASSDHSDKLLLWEKEG